MTKRDTFAVTAIGLEVGILFQPIIFNLWGDISGALARSGMSFPQAAVQVVALVGFTVLAPAALFILSVLSKKVAILFQFGKFAAVGSSNAFVDIGLLNLSMLIFGLSKGDPKFAVTATSTALIATVNSFLWNKFWTFEAGKSADKTWVELAKFYAVTGTAAVVNGSVTYFAVNYLAAEGGSLEVWANVAKIIGIFSALFINFIGYKFFVFKQSGTPPPSATLPAQG